MTQQLKTATDLYPDQSLRLVRRDGQVVRGYILPARDAEDPIEDHHNIRIHITDTGNGAKPGDPSKPWWKIGVTTLFNTCQVFQDDER